MWVEEWKKEKNENGGGSGDEDKKPHQFRSFAVLTPPLGKTAKLCFRKRERIHWLPFIRTKCKTLFVTWPMA